MATIRHIAFFIDDPDRLAAFYHDVFDMEITRRSPTGISTWITDGYMDIALIRRRGLDRPKGINHWGFTLDKGEKDKVYEGLRARGLDPFDPRRDGLNAPRPFVEEAAHDIHGNRFDISLGMREIEPGKQTQVSDKRKADIPATTPKIRHIALFTKDPGALGDFYHDVFGMEIVGKTGRGATWITDGYVNFALLQWRSEKTPLGINHFGFTLTEEDQPRIYDRLKARDIEIFTPGRDRPYVEEAARDIEGNRFDMSCAMREIDEEMARPRTAEELVDTETI